MSKRLLLFAAAALFSAGATALADDAAFRVQPNEVLVVFNDTFKDADGNGRSDSRDVAEYYAARRGVPAENLVPLDLKGARGNPIGGDYPEFYEHILTPVAKKLGSPTADGTAFKARIVYIVVCYGVPMRVNTHHDGQAGEHPVRPGKKVKWSASRRSLDQWLIDVHANFEGGYDEETKKPTRTGGGVLGGKAMDIRHPELWRLYINSASAKHFKELKRKAPDRFPYYLVARLGLGPVVAAGQVDGAIYAERYLRVPSDDDKDTAWRPRIVLDHQPGFAADHVAAQARLAGLLAGSGTAPLFSTDHAGLLRPWPRTADNQRAEIGQPNKEGAAHLPTLTAVIAEDGVDAVGRLVTLERGRAGRRRPPMVQYFSPGLTVTASSGGTARIEAIDVAKNALRLTAVDGFKPGDTITWAWRGPFPISDAFFYYGFYGLGKKWDCYRFVPGAIGVHVDSSCMNWARRQLDRGLCVAFGVVQEPFSAGIPYMDRGWAGIATGHDVCESLYAGLALNTRWAGVLFADPLYAPFRSLQLIDRTAPVLENVTATPRRAGELVVSADLADGTPDERADIALFRVEYGPTRDLGSVVPYTAWPEPGNTGQVAGRRYRYTRRFRHTIRSLKPGVTYRVRVSARDPHGNESDPSDVTGTTRSGAGR